MNRLLIAIPAVFIAVPAQATIYQCVNGSQIAYQDHPCSQGADSWQQIDDGGRPVGERYYDAPAPDEESSSQTPAAPSPIIEQPIVESGTSSVAPTLEEQVVVTTPTVSAPVASNDTVPETVRKSMPTPFVAQTSGQSASLSGIGPIEDAQAAATSLPTETDNKHHQSAVIAPGSGSFHIDLSVWENLKKGTSLSDIKQYFPETLPGNQALGDDFDHELLRADAVSFNGHRYEALFFFDQHTDKETPRFTQLRLSPGSFISDAENQQIMIDDVAVFRERYGKEASNQTVDGVFGSEKVVKWKLSAATLTLKLEPFVTGQSTYTIRYTPK